MNTLPISAAANLRGWNTSSEPASAVPTSTGATAAGNVRGRAATSHSRAVLKRSTRLGRVRMRVSRSLRELPEVRGALLLVGVPALLGLLAGVEQEVGVVGQLLQAGEPVLGSVEARLHQAQGEGRELEHLAAPFDGL